MARTIACFVTALLTFLVGVALHSSYRLNLELLPEEADVRPLVKPLPVEHQESQVPLRLGFFIVVGGVTLSSDNSKFNRFDDYRERETAILVSPNELSKVVHKLAAAGLLEEQEWNTPSFISLPVTDTIIVAWPDRTRAFNWIVPEECRVPEKNLSVLEEVNVRHDAPLIKDFITHNRR